MTIEEYSKLKPGDKVWLNPSMLAYPMPGVIVPYTDFRDSDFEVQPRYAVRVNLYGDGELIWYPCYLDVFLGTVMIGEPEEEKEE